MNDNNNLLKGSHRSDMHSQENMKPKRILLNKLNPNIEMANFKMKKVIKKENTPKIQIKNQNIQYKAQGHLSSSNATSYGNKQNHKSDSK